MVYAVDTCTVYIIVFILPRRLKPGKTQNNLQ